MRFFHGTQEYALPDEWWAEAGMHTFIMRSRSFQAGPAPSPGLHIIEVGVNDVQPLRRKASHGVFNDSSEFGSAHDRVLSILRGFREGSAIPPIEVARLPSGSSTTFKLIHGAHRFYCAVATGFSYVPAIEVADFLGES